MRTTSYPSPKTVFGDWKRCGDTALSVLPRDGISLGHRFFLSPAGSLPLNESALLIDMSDLCFDQAFPQKLVLQAAA